MKREFVATVYVLFEGKTLLHFHPKLQKYLPPGGHLEKNETPQEAAYREVLEETGIDITFIQDENIWLEQEKNCKSLIRPYLCLLEEIPPYKDIPYHQHIDFIYLAKPLQPHKVPLQPFTWFSWEDIIKIPSYHIFPDTIKVLQEILQEPSYHLR